MNEAFTGEVVDSEFEDWSDIDTSNLKDEADALGYHVYVSPSLELK